MRVDAKPKKIISMGKRLVKKKDMIDQIKRKLREFGQRGYYLDELPDCEESYKCLEKLNNTVLIKISLCLTYLSDYDEELDYRNYGE